MLVVIWEPKQGNGGGHQLVADPARADQLRWQLGREKPECLIRIEDAGDYGAAAVLERGRRYRYG